MGILRFDSDFSGDFDFPGFGENRGKGFYGFFLVLSVFFP